MDTIGLVEDKESGYKYENLHYDQKAFIDGIREALQVVKNAAYDYELNAETSESVRDAIELEIVNEFVETVETLLYATECEYIVAFGDDNYCETEE